MSSPATSSLTIGSIFDLIGPAAPTPSVDHDAPAFGALLQSPPSTGPGLSDDSSRSSLLGELPRSAADPQRSSALDQPPSAEGPPSNSQGDPQPRRSTPSQGTESAAAAPRNQGDGPSQDSPPEADEVLVESLAGLSVAHVAPVLPAGDQAAEETATDSQHAVGPAPAKPQTRPALRVAPGALAQPGRSQVETDGRDKAPEDEPASKAKVRPELLAANGQPTAVAKTSELDSSTQEIGDDGRPSSALAGTNGSSKADLLAQGDEKAHQHDGLRSSEVQATVEISPDVPSSPSDTLAAALPAAALAPEISPQAPVTDAPRDRSVMNSATPVITAAPPQRSRLPGELWTHATAATDRRPVIEVDTARLLTRVARAFTAAQERDGEVHLRLSPPELGSLHLEVKVQDGALVARLQTETEAARAVIVDNLPSLRDRLADQGVRIERFDVDLMQRQAGGGMPDQPGSRQPDFPLAPPRGGPPTRTSAGPSPVVVSPHPVATTADGLNVII